ncbi:NAD-dependent epimerase/dehydratase family protein [Acuticoccus sp.]|uniref:NAD-dependent epimerase/dehydratase family protein n=1 Tax=Acuticoccus sp. TaxID=1904378 RepID=UPI003B523734
MSVLVVGGAGFVGLNVAEHLLTAGRAVRILDAAPPPQAALAAFDGLTGTLDVALGDVRDPQVVAAAMVDATHVVFGAAITSGPEREAAEPGRVLDVNLRAFLTVLEAARDAGVRRVVNLSSGGAYGEAAFRPGVIHEDRPADPRTLYALTKFASERLGARMAALWGIEVVSARLSSVFGRWERRTGVRDTPSPQFQIVEAACDGASEIVLPGDSVRDWIYGPDVARAVALLLDAGELTHPLYNVSTGATFGVLEWGRAFARARGGLTCRLAEAGETATIAWATSPPREPLAVDRLADATGFAPAFDCEASARDTADFVSRVPIRA